VKFVALDGLINYLESLDLIIVSGKGCRKSCEQRDLEIATEYNEKLHRYDTYLEKIGDTRKSMSKTDTDATFMRLKEDHMKNGQLKAAYNVQLCIEGEYIVSFDVSSERSDSLTLVPFLDKVKSEYERKHKNVITDAGYESEENYDYLTKQKQTAYIKPLNYEQSKKRSYKQQIGKKENMEYDSVLNRYICANGKDLNPLYEKIRKSVSGYEQLVTVYECEDCSGCQLRARCTQAKDGNNKKLECSRKFEEYRVESLKNITSPLGIQLRVNRSIQAEGVFGIIKQDYAFRRFARRGKKEISTELALVCLAYNINKLHGNLINDRTGFTLHEVDTK
jgi:hypothetical protein